jgi:hypothetical protein
MTNEAPEFDKAPSFISDVQMTHAVSDDGKAITIAFGNFTAAIVPFGPPQVTRTFSLVLPLKNVAAGARVTGGLQGGGAMEPGTKGMLIFRAAGVSQAFDPLFGPDETTGFLKPINLPVPAGEDLRMTIVLGLEGSASDPKAQAAVNMTTLDLTIEPGQPELHV